MYVDMRSENEKEGTRAEARLCTTSDLGNDSHTCPVETGWIRREPPVTGCGGSERLMSDRRKPAFRDLPDVAL
jgi:hypothetical protein